MPSFPCRLSRTRVVCFATTCVALIICFSLPARWRVTVTAQTTARVDHFPASCPSNPVVTNTNDSGAGSLRDAIANACVGDVINFAREVTSGGPATITLTSGELTINHDLSIGGPGVNLLTISGNGASRIFNIQSGTVSIFNLTIANGKVAAGNNGGGVLNNGTLTLHRCNVFGNTATLGGGVYNDGPLLDLQICNIGGTGAGQANSALSGGGLFNNSGTLRAGASVVGNSGGGISVAGGTVNLLVATITDNSNSIGSGGGVSITGGLEVNVFSCLIANNTARTGGGLYLNGSATPLTVISSTISANRSSGEGGGVVGVNGTIALSNVTITDNHSDSDDNGGEQGGGIFRSGGQVVVKNTIVASNIRGASQGGTSDDINGAVDTNSAFNLIGTGGSGGLANGINGNQVGVTDLKLGPLASYQTLSQFRLPLPGSPAINAGSNALLPPDTFDLDNNGNTSGKFPFDQRRATRIVNSTVDIGAIETNYETSATTGSLQSTAINTAFSKQLQATVWEVSPGVAVRQVGLPVTFTAPNSGASGTFPGTLTAVTVNTDSDGVATAPVFTANNTIGGPYVVVASIGPGLPTASFNLTNTQVQPSISIGDASITEGDSGSKLLSFSVMLSASSSQTIKVDYRTANGTAITPDDYVFAADTLTFNPGETAKTLPVTIIGDTIFEPNESFFVDLSNPANATISRSRGVGTILNDDGGLIGFSQANYSASESGGSIILMVQRTGNLTGAVSVDYATSGDAGLPCATVNGLATPKCDFTAALGTLKFAAGENSKTIIVLISQDSFVEGSETFTMGLSNPTSGAALASPATATVTIADDASEPSTNPIDDASNFVRQQYHDFLNREPDASGLAFWTDQIASCGSDQACIDLKRINVSAAFFLSIEFQDTGYLVERLYKTAYGDASGLSTFGSAHQLSVPVVRFNEFLPDTQAIGQGVVVGQGNWQTQLGNNKQAFAADFVQRSRFVTAFPTTLTPAQFVDQMNTNAGNVLSASERTTAIGLFGSAIDTSNATARAGALRQVAEDADLNSAEFNRAFVLMQYFGYLRRNPNDPQDTDYTGYDFWLTKLNQFNGNFVNAEMVKAFITSAEYRNHFGH